MRTPALLSIALLSLPAAVLAEEAREPDDLEAALGDLILPAQFQRRPGESEPIPPPEEPPPDPTALALPDPDAFPGDFTPIPDRWRIVEGLGVNERWYDPYNQNTLKGDRPIIGNDIFLIMTGISDTVIEPRSLPTPVGIQSGDPGSNDVFGDPNQFFFSQTFLASASLVKGDTAFKPQDFELRLTGAFNYNYTEAGEDRVLFADPSDGRFRNETFFSLQEGFIDYHIRNVSDRYDFDSIRVGIQPFTADFRGFLFQDLPLGVRLFGTRENNLWQYNLAWFRMFDKDINSGLNDLSKLSNDSVFVGNLYRQDFPILGMTSQATIVHDRNRDDARNDQNGFPARPAQAGFNELPEYDVTYFGLNFDGRAGLINLTGSGYFAIGDTNSSLLTGEDANIQAFFLAAEPSVDFDWGRVRLSALYASGDDNPRDGTDRGFDAIFENPLFAGADTSYWIRQAVPLIGGGFVTLNNRNGVLVPLRHSKELGQANFVNPGITLLGGGVDFDLLPELRLSFNANYLRFNNTEVLEELRQQPDIEKDIGFDLSAATIWRPFFNQNVVLRLSGAMLLPGQGFDDLYGSSNDADLFYSVLGNIVLTY